MKVNIEGEEEEDNLNEDDDAEEEEDGIKDELRGGLIDKARGSMEIDGGGHFTAAQNFQASILKINLNASNVP